MSKEIKIPIQCPICSTIFFINPEQLKETINCPKCKVPLEIKAIPPVKTIQDAYFLSMIATFQNINKLYDALSKLLEKILGGR